MKNNTLTTEQQKRYDELCHKRYETNESLTDSEYTEWKELDKIAYPTDGIGKDLSRDFSWLDTCRLFD